MRILMCLMFGVLSKRVHTNKSFQDWSCKNKVADIVFLLDSSVSIWKEDFDKQLVFVEHIVNQLPVGENGVRVAAATFGTDVKTCFHLDDFFDKTDLLDAIYNIHYREGRTNTGSAIKHARKIMFSEKHGGRKTVEKVLVVITDGYSIDPLETANEASICRSHGIKLISVGVGHGVEEYELKHIASEVNGVKLVYTVNDFDSLNSIEDVITRTTCDAIGSKDVELSDETVKGTPTIPTKDEVRTYCDGKPADVYFVVDSSSSIRKIDYKKILNFITDVIDLFDVTSHSTRVGVVAFSDSVHPVITLDNKLSPKHLKHEIINMRHYEGGTQTGNALRYLRQEGLKRGFARENVAHVVILLTDGMSSDAKLTLEESKILKGRGTYLFAIGIGDQVDTQELQDLSSYPRQDFVFLMEDFQVLSAIKNLLAIKTCKGIPTHTSTDKNIGKSKTLQDDAGEELCTAKTAALDVLYVYDSQFLAKDHSDVIENLISEMILATAESRVNTGLVTRACDKPLKVPLYNYKNIEEVKPFLKRSEAEGIAAVLKHARIEGFSLVNGGRDGVAKKVVLFVNGYIEDRNLKVRLAAKRLKFRSDLELFVVTFEKEVNEVVVSLVEDRQNLIQNLSARTLSTVKKILLEKICRN